MTERKQQIRDILKDFGVRITDIREIVGKSLTLYEIKPASGVRISKIRGLKDEIAIGLGVTKVRIIAPMEDGKVGIEVPNKEREIVPVSELLKSWEYQNADMELPCVMGRTVTNDIFIADLAQMPHLLVAGATGQGKSVGLNVILMSLLNSKTPEEMQLLLIDPKRVELSPYSAIEKQYLAAPVVTETDDAEAKLKAVCELMDERYELISTAQVRNIQEYNKLSAVEKIPYLVVVIDEYGDLVMTAGKQMEQYICRIAQKARAVGIHMIVSTQRPSATIVTGNIKANFPTRIAFRTTTGTDSRVVLDQTGAEKLTGKGDMLYFSGSETTRVQCAYASMAEVTDTLSKLCKEYKDFYGSAMLSKKEPPIVLSEPIHLLTMKVARMLPDRLTKYWISWQFGISKEEGLRILRQLYELRIIGDPVERYNQDPSYPVLIRDKDEIRNVILRHWHS